MNDENLTAAVRLYLQDLPPGALPPDAEPEDASFLARGEYSLNYRVRGGSGPDLVARRVMGTKMGLPLGIVSLRAVSWCAWALQETAQSSRPIANEETLRKSCTYLEPAFLKGLFGP